MTSTEVVAFVQASATESQLRHWVEPIPAPSHDPEPVVINVVAALTAAVSAMVRWPVERTGDRELISWPVRLGVGRRDNFTCRRCHIGFEVADMELDHIIPWSAGGTDRSHNLRVLCKRHNQERSNFVDGTEHRPMLPVTWWCVECWHVDDFVRTRNFLGSRDVGLYDMNISHRVQSGHTLAYCAYCQHISRTDVTL